MQLDHTIIFPANDDVLAKKLFSHLIYDEDVIVAIVLGNDELSQKVVQLVDKRAKPVVNGFARKVGWVTDRNILQKEIKELKAGSADISKEDLNKVMVFFVTLDNKVCKILHREDEIDFLSVDMGFLAAGKL
ncbi:MAG: hypothetical protein NTX65_02540 [Ignavibacteriales bacterium]|nr:hypothetical protein [Ignavibacteriales bacterium]